jgi:hypothetical protein
MQKFLLKLTLSLAMAALAALCISHNFASFAIVFLVVSWAICPVRALHIPAKKVS